MSTTTILVIEMPENRLQDFIQRLRDFEQTDTTNIHVRAKAQVVDVSADDMMQMLSAITPAIPHRVVIRKPNEN